MSAFSVDTGWRTTPPLVDGMVHTRLVSSHHTVRCAHKSGYVINFIIVACRIALRLKWYKNYKNRLRLAKVIVKNKMSRFYGSLCNRSSLFNRCSMIWRISTPSWAVRRRRAVTWRRRAASVTSRPTWPAVSASTAARRGSVTSTGRWHASEMTASCSQML